jgi:hypothetical protein
MKPETGVQPADGKMTHDSAHGEARLHVPQDEERASRVEHPVKDKFARVWGTTAGGAQR